MASFFLLDGEGSLRSHNDISDVLILSIVFLKIVAINMNWYWNCKVARKGSDLIFRRGCIFLVLESAIEKLTNQLCRSVSRGSSPISLGSTEMLTDFFDLITFRIHGGLLKGMQREKFWINDDSCFSLFLYYRFAKSRIIHYCMNVDVRWTCILVQTLCALVNRLFVVC